MPRSEAEKNVHVELLYQALSQAYTTQIPYRELFHAGDYSSQAEHDCPVGCAWFEHIRERALMNPLASVFMLSLKGQVEVALLPNITVLLKQVYEFSPDHDVTRMSEREAHRWLREDMNDVLRRVTHISGIQFGVKADTHEFMVDVSIGVLTPMRLLGR